MSFDLLYIRVSSLTFCQEGHLAILGMGDEMGAKFRHTRATSQINFMGSAEGTTILGVRGHAPGKILQNYT